VDLGLGDTTHVLRTLGLNTSAVVLTNKDKLEQEGVSENLLCGGQLMTYRVLACHDSSIVFLEVDESIC
jgi:hypothetical protein